MTSYAAILLDSYNKAIVNIFNVLLNQGAYSQEHIIEYSSNILSPL